MLTVRPAATGTYVGDLVVTFADELDRSLTYTLDTVRAVTNVLVASAYS